MATTQKVSIIDESGTLVTGAPIGRVGRPGSSLCVATSKGQACGTVAPTVPEQRSTAAPARGGLLPSTAAHGATSITGKREKPSLIDGGIVLASAAGSATFLSSKKSGTGLLWSLGFGGLGALIYSQSAQAELQSIGAGMLGGAGSYLMLRALQRVTVAEVQTPDLAQAWQQHDRAAVVAAQPRGGIRA